MTEVSLHDAQRLYGIVRANTICYWECCVRVMHTDCVRCVSATSLYDDVVLTSVVKGSCSLVLVQCGGTPRQSPCGLHGVLFMTVRYTKFGVSWSDGIEWMHV